MKQTSIQCLQKAIEHLQAAENSMYAIYNDELDDNVGKFVRYAAETIEQTWKELETRKMEVEHNEQ